MINIKDDRHGNLTEFKDVSDGQAFIYENKLCIKSANPTVSWNCFNVTTKLYNYIYPTCPVEVVNLDITIRSK